MGDSLVLGLFTLTPKEAQMDFFIIFFALLIVRSCPRLLGEHVQKVSKTSTARIVRL
jgi:hypothetical protein